MAQRRIRGVTLDAEGPLFELEKEGHHLAHRLAARDAGFEITHDDFLANIPNIPGGPGAKTAEQLHALALSRNITPTVSPQEMLEGSRYHFDQIFEEIRTGKRRLELRPGFIEFYHTMKVLGLQMAVGTSTWPDQFWVYYEVTGLSKFFTRDEIKITGDASGLRRKPAPDVFLETARVMGINPDEQLVIGDSRGDVEAGTAAGSTVVGMTVYRDPKAIIPLYEAGAFAVFSDWREVNWQGLIANLNEGV